MHQILPLPQDVISPTGCLEEAQHQVERMLTDIGALRSTLDSCPMNNRGKMDASIELDCVRNMLNQLYGRLALLLNQHERSIEDFGLPVSKAPF